MELLRLQDMLSKIVVKRREEILLTEICFMVKLMEFWNLKKLITAVSKIPVGNI